MKTFLIGAVSLLAVAAPATAQVMSPGDYVMTAGASDMFERQSAQIVLATTRDPKIKSFATMMIAAHGKSTAEVKAAAAHSRVPAAAPALTPLQTELIAELRAESGPARDATYVAQQKAAHGQALAVQKAYAMEGTAPALRDTAAGIVPVVQSHIKMLMGL